MWFWMVDADAYNGTYTKNPFNFKNYDTTFLGLTVNGEHLPRKLFQLKFAVAGGTNYVSAYQILYAGTNKMFQNQGNGITHYCVTSTTDMNTLQILNILKNDPFTKSVFTDVLPSDLLPNQIQKKPRRFILNVDPNNGPGTHWIAIYFTADGKGELFYSY